MDKKDKILILTLNSFLIIYITLISYFFNENGYFTEIATTRLHTGIVLLIMFMLELISTITFSLRIYFTGKDKYNKAGIIGMISWLVAGAQGILFISGNIIFDADLNNPNNLNFVWTYLTKAPIIAVATYLGIYLNLKYYTKWLQRRDNEN